MDQEAAGAALERFRFEAQAAGNLEHPHIAAIHEVGEHEGQQYFSLAGGDDAGYRRICGRIVETFLRGGDANQVNNAVWICAVGPAAVKDFGPLVRELTRVLGPQPDADRLNTLGALLYRAGRFEDAVKRLEQAIARRDKVGTVHDILFLAMAHQRLGHGDEARKWLEKSGRAVEQAKDGSWDQRLEVRLLRREAEALIRPARCLHRR